jgi:hypothetical protein
MAATRRRHEGADRFIPDGEKRSIQMSRVPQYMYKVAGWEVTNTGLTANKVEHLEGHRVELEEKMVLFKDLSAQHAAFTTSKQEVAKKMQTLFREVETLVAFIRTGLRQHHGKDSEQLIQYGLQPFRGLKASEEKAAKPKTSGASGEPTPAS